MVPKRMIQSEQSPEWQPGCTVRCPRRRRSMTQSTGMLQTNRPPVAGQLRLGAKRCAKHCADLNSGLGPPFSSPQLSGIGSSPTNLFSWLSVSPWSSIRSSVRPAAPLWGWTTSGRLFNNPLFMISVRNTLTWAFLSFIWMLPIALGISLCLVNVRRGRNLYQGLIFLPVVISLVAIALLFRMLMDPEVGQFNQILESLGLPGFTWLSSSDTALPTHGWDRRLEGVGLLRCHLDGRHLEHPNGIAGRSDGGWRKPLAALALHDAPVAFSHTGLGDGRPGNWRVAGVYRRLCNDGMAVRATQPICTISSSTRKRSRYPLRYRYSRGTDPVCVHYHDHVHATATDSTFVVLLKGA